MHECLILQEQIQPQTYGKELPIAGSNLICRVSDQWTPLVIMMLKWEIKTN